MRVRRPDDLEAGFSIVEILVGAGIFAALLISVIFATAGFGKSLRQSSSAEASTASLTTIVESLERDGRSAIAIFTPATDVANRSNADGHEIDFYTRDAAGKGAFAAYCYKAASATCATAQTSGSLGLYHYTWAALPANGGSGATLSGSVADNITTFASTTLAASALLDSTKNPTTAAYFAKIGVTTVNDVARQTGYPNVLAGNRVTILSFSTATTQRTIHLLAGSMPTRRAIIVASYTPPPNAMTLNGGSAALNFTYPLAAAQTVTFAESNYGTRSTTPAQTYTVIGNTCSSSATYTPGTITPTTDGTGDGSMAVQPIVKPEPSGATCTVTVADNSAQTQTLSVTIGQTYTPTSTGPTAGVKGSTGTFSLTEQNYPTLPFTIALSGACSSATMETSAQNHSSYREQIRVTYGATGVCIVQGTDAYGQTTSISATITNPALTPGACTATQDPTNPTTALDLSCSAPSGGSGAGYAVAQYAAPESATLDCNWASYSCVMNGLAPGQTYTFSPLFGDGSGTRAWGADFSGITGGAATPTPAPAPTCPAGTTGSPPNCVPLIVPPTPSGGPCTPDSAGYCEYNYVNNVQNVTCGNVDGWHVNAPSGTQSAEVYNAFTGTSTTYTYIFQFLNPVAEGDDQCYYQNTWGYTDPTNLYPTDQALENELAGLESPP